MPDLKKSATAVVKRLTYTELATLARLFENPDGAGRFADAVREQFQKWGSLPQPGTSMRPDEREQFEALQDLYRVERKVIKPKRRKN